MAQPSTSGGERLVNTTTTSEQTEPSIAALSGGGFVVVWRDGSASGGDTSGQAVRGQRFDSSGNAAGGEFLINTTTFSHQGSPAVAALSGGGFVVAWADQSASGGDTSGQAIRGQRYDSSGNTAGTEFLINTTTTGDQTRPTVAGLSGGGFVVAWEDASASGADVSSSAVRAQRYDSSGNTAGTEFLVNTTTTNAQDRPSVTVLTDGGFVIVWRDASASGGDTSGTAIRGQRFNASGGAVGSEFLVNTTTAGAQGEPSVSALQGGGYIVAWEDASASGGDTFGSAVRARRYDASGNPVGSEFLVNTTVTSDQTRPTATGLPNGGFIVAWQDASATGGDPSSSAIRAQAYDSGGNPDGGEFLVNTATFSTQGEPSSAVASGGRLLIAWEDTSQSSGDVSGNAIRAQFYTIIVPSSGGSGGGSDGGSGHVSGTDTGDRVIGSDGGDVVSAMAGDDLVLGFDGNDTLSGGAGADQIFGHEGADVLYGGDDPDALHGGADGDRLYGNRGADLAYGNSGRDTIYGGQDTDTLYGGQDDDVVYGNLGNDLLFGNGGPDRLYGGQGADSLYGNAGVDVLFGNAGEDTLHGGQGADELFGGAGNDSLIGGLGADRFQFGTGDGSDTIADFDPGAGDVILLVAGINGTAIADAADLLSRLGSDGNGNAVLDAGTGNIITIVGVQAADASADWFRVL